MANKKIMYMLSRLLGIPFLPPRSISIEIATVCNMRCRICSQWRDSIEEPAISSRDVRKVIDEISRYFPGCILEFSGQEPTTNREVLLGSMEYGQKKDVGTALNTNGLVIDKKFAQGLITREPEHISVSLDGASASTHDYLRNRKCFAAVINAIQNLVNAKRELSAKTVISVTSVICSANLDEIIGIHKLANQLGADTVNYNAFVPDNSYFLAPEKGYDSEFWVTGKELPLLREVIREIIKLKKTGVRPLITNPVEQLGQFPIYFEKMSNFPNGRCLAGYNYFHIHKSGAVTVCGKGPFLNIKDRSIRDIWHGPEFCRTRKMIKKCRTPCINNCFHLM